MAKSLYDSFKIINKKELNSDDIYCLTYLYMPLLGMDSFSLYIALSTFDINEVSNYKKLIDLLSISTLSVLVNAINKLEGIGLIKEYKKENPDEVVLYYLNKPLSVNEFLKDEALRVLLEGEIGSDAVLKLLEKDRAKKAPVGYIDATKSFCDVFEISTSDEEKIWKEIFGDKKTDLIIENKEFNYTLFETYVDTSFISKDVLEDSEFKRNITHLSFVYKLDEEQMKDCVIKSLDLDKDLSYEVLSKNAKYMFQETYQVKNPRLVSQEDDTFMDSAKDDKVIALCSRLESTSFIDTLESLSGMKPASSEVEMFDKLYSQSNLTIGAINVMIMMASSDKEGVLPGLNYFEKIANTWARAKVKNAYDAFKFTEREREKRKASMAKGTKREVSVPLWYSEYIKELDKKEDKASTTSQTTLDIIAAAKELFGE